MNQNQALFELLDNVIGEMEARFNNQSVSLSNAVSALLVTSQVFLEYEVLKPLIQLLELDMSLTHGELPVAKKLLSSKLSQNSSLQDTAMVIILYKDAFPNVFQLYIGAVTIGISTATCENSFSAPCSCSSPTSQINDT